MNVLVTGANGFIGRSLCDSLIQKGYQMRATMRKPDQRHVCSDQTIVSDIDTNTPWLEALEGIDVVIHLAARAHVLNDTSTDPLAEFRKINVDGTLNLARQAVKSGVKRFIFFSSIGVLGAETLLNPFSETSEPKPHSDYAISKLEAEEALKKICDEAGMAFVIIRPPLVYGAGAPGNFARLLKLVALNLPLPLGSIKNQRSMVSLENLVDFVNACLVHPNAVNQTFLVADGTDVSTPQLIRLLGEGMGKSANLLPVPVRLLEFGALITGKKNMLQQLCHSLQIDSSKARNTLDWAPPVPVADGLRLAAQQYLANKH